MPCGGIYGVEGHFSQAGAGGASCFQCRGTEPRPELFVEEWDAFLHRDCLGRFLLSPEGLIILKHGHEIVVPEVDPVDG